MITYREDFALWWPNYDHAPEACHKRVVTRVRDLDATIAAVTNHSGIVVQAGGHAGVWPIYLAHHFSRVHTFEPEPALFACLLRNVELEDMRAGVDLAQRIIPKRAALSRIAGHAMMQPHCSAGSWSIKETGTVRVETIAIDELELPGCDAIVLDIEGHELEALAGAYVTIARFRPVIHLEVATSHASDVHAYMRHLGYIVKKKAHADVIFVPERPRDGRCRGLVG